MNVLQFSDKMEELLRDGVIGKRELADALITALLEVDSKIRYKVVDKVMKMDFNIGIGAENSGKEV